MISDTLEGLADLKHDVCIVGAGPAGLSCALEMATSGKSVLVLESGGMHADAAQQSLSIADILDPARHDDMRIAVARRLGGTSNLWAGRCVPFDPIDFLPRPHFPEVAWPIQLEDVRQYYPQASKYLSGGQTKFEDLIPGVSIPEDEIAFQRLERYSNCPAIQIGQSAALKQNDRIDIRLNSTVVDIDLNAKNKVQQVTAARPDGRTFDIPVKTLVLACGGLETTRQLLVLQRKRTGLFGGEHGPLGKYYMGHVTGEIADITFSDARMESAFNFYVDDDGTYVRRRFVPSDAIQLEEQLPNIAFWPVVPPISDAAHRSGILSLLFLALASKPFGKMFIAEVIRKKHVPDGVKKMPHLANVLRELPQSALFGFSFLSKRYFSSSRIPGFFVPNPGHRYGLSYHAEQRPNRESQVHLSDEKDRLGVPRLRIDLRFSQEDAAGVVRAHELFENWLTKHEVATLAYRQPEARNEEAVLEISTHGTHQIGTARMGKDPQSAVVDGNLKTFDCPNLYLLTSAVFPGSGQCNPTLTIAALAVRLTKHLAEPANTE